MKDMNGKTIKVGDLLDPFQTMISWPYSYVYRIIAINDNDKKLVAKNSIGVTTLNYEACSHMIICGHIRPVDDKLTKHNLHEYDLTRACLSDRELVGYDFSGLVLDEVSFNRARLDKCRFDNTIIQDCNFEFARIRNTTFEDARIIHTVFDCSRMFDARFITSTLLHTDFDAANMDGSRFDRCTIDDCSFRFTMLAHTDFVESVISKTDLKGTSMANANLMDTKMDHVAANPYTSGYYMACPEEGAFIGWKRCADDDIVKLLITEDAKRSSATSRKCRCSKAKVLSIEKKGVKRPSHYVAHSGYAYSFTYKVGEIVEVPDFDEDRWHECAPGIHFFLTKQEAIDFVI